MTKLFQKIIILIILVFTVFSCSSSKKTTTNTTNKETFIEQDAKAPVGYKPNYVNNLDIFRIDTAINYTTKVIHTEVKNGKVRIYFNITDDRGKAYVRANLDKWSKVWCLAQEESGGEVYPVKNYQIFHNNERDTVPYAFAFVLDHSGSMGDLRVLTVQNALSNLLTTEIKSEDAAAVIKYDNRVVVEFPLTKDDKVFMSQLKVNGIADYGGTSAISDALDQSIDILDAAASFTNKWVVIFTDGKDNASKTNQIDVISKAKQKGIKIFAIDFGIQADPAYMRNLASQTGGCYYHIYNLAEFTYIFTDIYKRMKNLYVFEYSPTVFGKSQFKLNLCNGNKKIVLTDSIDNETAIGNHILVNIKFDAGKSTVKTTYKSEIEKLVKIINNEPNLKFQIQVHTDDLGDAKANLTLSQKRADAIKNELVKKGIDKSRLTAKGFGESTPIADNKTKEGKNKNRRVEFVVME